MDHEELGIMETIRDLKNREPFLPFRIGMTSGESYIVESPDLLALAKSQVVYCLPRSDRTAYLRVNQIATVDELEIKAIKRRKR